jgi:Spx/MgsR family transcriptional regulator
MATTIHGIKSCDTMAKARAWLDAHAIPYRFHDYKAQGLTEALLRSWVRQLGWEMLLNRAGTTFRKLPEPDRQNLDEARAIRLMLAQPSMVKRPVLDVDGTLLVGFRPDAYAARFGP